MASGSSGIKTEYAEDIENWTSDLRTVREQILIIFESSYVLNSFCRTCTFN